LKQIDGFWNLDEKTKEKEVNNYKIVMLGSSGSGKTVFLSSIFHELSTQGERGFFLRVEGKGNQALLTRLYQQVAINKEWPSGTKLSDVSELTFTCYVQAENLSIFPTFQFTYLDYAGGRLTDDSDDELDNEFEAEIQRADALLGLLDGDKLLKALRGDNFASKTLHLMDLKNILQRMQNNTKKAPIYFVVSKWDLLEDEFTLEDIVAFLMETDGFKNLVKQHNKNQSAVRLIPVSSVGRGFAVPQPDGSMQKTGKLPKPFQVEMPLACVVPDILQHHLNQLNQQKERESARVIDIKPTITFWDKAGEFFGNSVGVVSYFLPLDFVSYKVLDKLSEFASYGARNKREEAAKRSEELREERDKTLQIVEDEATAVRHTITSFAHIRQVLVHQFPASDLRFE